MKRNLLVLSFLITLLLSVLTFAEKAVAKKKSNNNQSELTIAVASNFYYPLSILIEQSNYWSAHPIRLVSASSGTLYAQITKGAPFDLFFSADSKRPQNLESQMLAFGRLTYAQGKLVLWPGSKVNQQNYNPRKSIDVRGKLAIANPQLAPFGVAAKAYIDALKNAASLNQKLVLGASVTQAFQFVDSGNAQYGLLAESTLIQAERTFAGSKYSQYELIPADAYPAIIQQVVIVSRSKNKAQAQKFINFVLSSQSQQQLSELGYIPVKEYIK